MRHRAGIIGILLAFSIPFECAYCTNPGCAGSDLVVRNGHVVTMDDARNVFTAMAVRGERISGVGSDAEISSCIDSHTQVLDLQKRTVLPGLIDVHTHGILWAEAILRNDIDLTFPAVKSIADVVSAVRNKVSTAPPGAWIKGNGWDDAKLAEHRYITRHDLDAVAPNNPVYLEHVTGHLGAANSTALKLAGLSTSSPNPQGGILERDGHGELTGIVKDNAMRSISQTIPADAPDLPTRAAALATEKAAESGLTTIHDVWDGVRTFAGEIAGYQHAHREGRLKVRVQIMPGVSSVDDAIRLASLGAHTAFGDDYLKFGAVKMFADGGMGARTAAIYAPPPEGEPADNLGLLIWKPEDMQKAQSILAGAGWQLATHAIGDRAINEVLDGYEITTKQLQLKDPRFRIIHCGLSSPAVLKRLRDLHVVVDANPAFVYWIGSYFARYGPEREQWAYPGKSYFDYGIRAGAGSDVPVSPISPWWGMWAAVARRELKSGRTLVPEERIPVMNALEMYTRNGAYAGFEEGVKGSIEPGKFADFIVIDRDLLSIPADQIKDTRVLKTFVAGHAVYSAN
jgi:predicted amidohydrolase YtcJ